MSEFYKEHTVAAAMTDSQLSLYSIEVIYHNHMMGVCGENESPLERCENKKKNALKDEGFSPKVTI